MSFKVDFINIINENNKLDLEIYGDKEYGLNKSIINSIRRTLLTSIKTVAFDQNNINIITNTGSLHNEILKSRISLIPLNISPINYHNNYLFSLKVKNTDQLFMNITADMFDIYELNKQTKDIIKKQLEENT